MHFMMFSFSVLRGVLQGDLAAEALSVPLQVVWGYICAWQKWYIEWSKVRGTPPLGIARLDAAAQPPLDSVFSWTILAPLVDPCKEGCLERFQYVTNHLNARPTFHTLYTAVQLYFYTRSEQRHLLSWAALSQRSTGRSTRARRGA